MWSPEPLVNDSDTTAAATGTPVPVVAPVTFRAVVATVPGDLASWTAAQAAHGLPTVYFAGPDGTVTAGAGAAFVWTGNDSEPVPAAAGALKSFWQNARFESDDARRTARAFSVFPFEAGQAAGPWAGLPQALTIVPSELYVAGYSGGRTLSAGVRADGDARALPQLPNRIAPAAGNHWNHGDWCRVAGEAVEDIRHGELKKVVLVRQENCPLTREFDPVALVSRLRDRYPSCYVYWIHLDGADFIGATPELLVRTGSMNVSSVALAGTAPRGATAIDDVRLGMGLQANAKELSEHRLVVEFIRDTLSAYCRRLTVPLSPELVRYRTVQHLRTRIEGRLQRPVDVLELVEVLHPTPAVGGVPSRTAREWIARTEGPSRGWYSGPLGWSAPDGSGEFAVALRGALVRGGMANLFAGCGLVEGSDPESEWRETEWKLSAFRSVLFECEGERRERAVR